MSTSLGHTVPRYLVKHCSGWFCKHFLDEISVYTGRLRKARSTSPMWVGLARHSVPGLSRTKRQTLPWERESFSCLPALELGLRLFPAFRLGLKHWLFLGLFLFLPLLFFFLFLPGSWAGWPSDWNDPIGSLGSTVWRLTLHAFRLRVHSHVS